MATLVVNAHPIAGAEQATAASAAIRATVTAAKELSSPVHVLVIGPETAATAAAAMCPGVQKVLFASHTCLADGLAEPAAALLAALLQQCGTPSCCPFPADLLPYALS